MQWRWILLFSIVLSTGVVAQEVALQDTSGERGSVLVQPIVGEVPPGAQKIKIRLRYAYRLLVWQGMQPAEGYAAQCNQPKVVSETVDWDAGIAEIAVVCDSVTLPADQGIALLRWEVLAGSDSIAVVELQSIEVDGQPLPIAKAKGIIRITSPPVRSVEGDVLEILSENPLRYRLTVRYRLVAPSPVTFRVFATDGTKIVERQLPRQEAEVYLKQKFEFPEVYANGLYFLVMETERGAYVLPFTLVR